jgi:hypothetical protein
MGTTLPVEVAMERIRIAKPVRRKERPKILPLDARDPDVIHAKAIRARYHPHRRRVA